MKNFLLRWSLLVPAFALAAVGCGGGGGGGGNPGPTGDAVVGAQIAFYDGSGTELARATTDVNGNYTVTVPTTARRFHLIADSLPTDLYYRSYAYNLKIFSPLIDTCKAPVPNLPTGGTVTLRNIGVPKASGPPPPPPSGCALADINTNTVGNVTINGKIVSF